MNSEEKRKRIGHWMHFLLRSHLFRTQVPRGKEKPYPTWQGNWPRLVAEPVI